MPLDEPALLRPLSVEPGTPVCGSVPFSKSREKALGLSELSVCLPPAWSRFLATLPKLGLVLFMLQTAAFKPSFTPPQSETLRSYHPPEKSKNCFKGRLDYEMIMLKDLENREIHTRGLLLRQGTTCYAAVATVEIRAISVGLNHSSTGVICCRYYKCYL